MKDKKTSLAVNNFLHAVVVCVALALSTLALSDELSSFRGEEALDLAASAVMGASAAYGATLAQPWRAGSKRR
jgi:hypothetical protein